ncbi:cytochrome P450 [Streptomyces sp. NPDC005438]|uniref:cytochrome P450 family protein n=1 Tax=Streptomyces sp. NPDC005438 TaxID=3156880 RepID=UPI0033BC4B84
MTTAPESPEYHLDVTGSDLHGEVAMLRERGDAVQVMLPGGVSTWVVTRHQLLQDLLADNRVGKDARHWRELHDGTVPEGWPLLDFVTNVGMTTADGQDHRRLRTLVSQAFTPRRVDAMRPGIEETTHRLLDRLATFPAGEVVDVREHFAYPLPMGVIGQLLGIPEERYDDFHGLSKSLTSSTTPAEEGVQTRKRMHALLTELIAEKRAHPADDLTSGLIAATDQGDRLNEQELIGTLILMLVAGHSTTLNLITNTIRALLAHPDQLKLLTSGQYPWTAAVEETLRWDASVAHFPMRFAIEDIPLEDVTIRKGDALLASYIAAGRDPRQHGERADEFDLTREQTRHLTFGYGPHFCIGSGLARLEAAVAVPALFARFPDLRLAVGDQELTHLPSVVSNSVTALPVTLSRG